jgi:gamma-glutamylcyclotransferase
MDAFEKGYERRQVRVVLANGEELTAVTYFAMTTLVENIRQPAAAYLQKILRGAKQHGLPEGYIREIEAIGGGKAKNECH